MRSLSLGFIVMAALALSQFALSAAPARREMGLVPPPKSNLMGWENGGDFPALPEKGELVVQKARPADCRVVLGFVQSPVDGRPDSWGYNGVVQEYDNSQGYGPGGHWQNVTYEFVKDPGVRVSLGDDLGFNYLYIRGGFEGLIYRDVDALDGPGKGTLVAEIKNGTMGQGGDFSHILNVYRLALPAPVKARMISFFKRNNILSDVSFLRVGAAAALEPYAGSQDYCADAPLADLAALGPDFVRLPAQDPGEQHPCNFERRFFRAEDRTVTGLAEGKEGKAVALGAGAQVHFLTSVLPARTPVGAVRLDLNVQGAPEGNLLNLAVQDPLIGSQELIRIDVKMGKSGRVRVLLDFPDQLTAEGRRFWITLASQHTATLAPDSKFSLLTVTPEKAMAEYVAYRKFLLKGYFYVLSEARPWTGQKMSLKALRESKGESWNVQRVRPQLVELYTAVEDLEAVAPEDPVVAQYYHWLTRAGKPDLDPKDIPAMPAVPGVPRWAQLLSCAVETINGIPNWWIAHRMMPNGELGGFFSDDTDQFGWWLPGMMLDSEDFGPKVRRIFEVVAPQLLAGNLKDGINKHNMDALHAYEEGENHMCYMPLADYGDPRYVEWLMTSARSVEKWMIRTPEGGLTWRIPAGQNFGWASAQKPPATAAEKQDGNAALLLHSQLMLAWYNHNPKAIETITGWADPEAKNPWGYGGASIAFAAYWFTGDPKYLYLLPNGRDKRGNWWMRFKPEFVVHGKEARAEPWWKGYIQEVSRNYVSGDWSWAASQDREGLCTSLEYALYGNPYSNGAGAAKYKYIWTEAEMFTDRIFLPVEVVAQPMLGGYTVRNRIWPAYAVSYEKLGGDFAALVLDQGRDRLKVEMINLRDTPREGVFRVWQLDHGRYELKVGPDPGDDGVMGAVESAKTLELARMDAVPVSLPPRKLTVYELRQVEKLDDLCARADLAMSADDVKIEGSQVKVTVHNIGAAASRECAVAMVDAKGAVLARATLPPIEAPLDYTPRTKTVVLPAAPAARRVVVDPDNAVAEITKVNDSVLLK